jgi:hypothetical protein
MHATGGRRDARCSLAISSDWIRARATYPERKRNCQDGVCVTNNVKTTHHMRTSLAHAWLIQRQRQRQKSPPHHIHPQLPWTMSTSHRFTFAGCSLAPQSSPSSTATHKGVINITALSAPHRTHHHAHNWTCHMSYQQRIVTGSPPANLCQDDHSPPTSSLAEWSTWTSCISTLRKTHV